MDKITNQIKSFHPSIIFILGVLFTGCGFYYTTTMSLATNNTEIEQLKKDKADKETITEIKSDIREIKGDIKTLLKENGRKN